jgi:hypothetical protein
MGAGVPENQGLGGTWRQDEVTTIAIGDFMKETGWVGDGFRPGLAGGDTGDDSLNTGLDFEFSAKAADFFVQGFSADI